MSAGDYDGAVAGAPGGGELVPAGHRDLNYAYALFNLGKSLRLAGRPDEAIPILEQRLKIPNQTDAVKAELKQAKKEAGEGLGGEPAAAGRSELLARGRSRDLSAGGSRARWPPCARSPASREPRQPRAGWVASEARQPNAASRASSAARRSTERQPERLYASPARPRRSAARMPRHRVVDIGEVARGAGRRVPRERPPGAEAVDPARERHLRPLPRPVHAEGADDHRVGAVLAHDLLGRDLARRVGVERRRRARARGWGDRARRRTRTSSKRARSGRRPRSRRARGAR